jgi:hypothetical protein
MHMPGPISQAQTHLVNVGNDHHQGDTPCIDKGAIKMVGIDDT